MTASSTDTASKLPTQRLFWYALPQIPHGFALLPVVNYVPAFYADHLGMPFALVGLMLVLTRITDIITDPIIGGWSDGAKTRFGRRKPFIVLGLPILMLATWMVFVPPTDAGPSHLFWGLFFMYLGFTIVDIPYTAWGAELSNDYDERARVSAWRGAANSLGSIITLSIPLVLQALGHDDIALTMMAMAICFLILQPLCFGLALWKVPEPPQEIIAVAPASWRTKTAILLKNGPLLRLGGAMVLLVAGMAIGATLNMIMFKHVVGNQSYFAWAVFVQNIVAVIAIPVWLEIAKRLGKHRAVAFGAIWIALSNAATFAFGQGDGLLLAASVVSIGFAMGGTFALVSAMVADLVDRDIVETGQERTGTFVAVLGVATKFAVVLGVLVGTTLPSLAGFQPSDAVHSQESLTVLRAVYAFVCPVLVLPAIWLLWSYPLTRKVQQELRARIDRAKVV